MLAGTAEMLHPQPTPNLDYESYFLEKTSPLWASSVMSSRLALSTIRGLLNEKLNKALSLCRLVESMDAKWGPCIVAEGTDGGCTWHFNGSAAQERGKP